MKTRRLLSIVMMLALVAALLAGCGGGSGGAVTVTDMMGREVTLAGPAEKVVAVTAADCEILYALGAGDKLVGRGEYCDYPPEVLEVTSVQSGFETNVEQIIALEPDLVLMASMNQLEDVVTQLEAAGIAVVVNEAYDIAGTYTSIELIGRMVGKDEDAAKLVADMKQSFEDLAANVPEGEKGQSVYYEVSELQYGLWTAGDGSFMNEIGNMLGLENVFSDMGSWAEISQEQVIERNPDYIVTVSMYYGEGPTPEEEITGREGWQDITAVKNGAILHVGNNEFARPGPRLVDGAQMLFDFVYGG